MSVVETIRGLRKLSVAGGEDGTAATPPPSPRNAQSRSVADYVAAIGGLDGLRAILTRYWRSDRMRIFQRDFGPEWLEDRNVPKDLAELLMNGIEEALFRGFLEEHRAVDMAVRRVQVLIEENITLPLMRDKERVLQLIREKEEVDWKLITAMMG